MAKKTPEDKLLDATLAEKYQLKFEELMDLIPQSNVFMEDTSFKEYGVILRSCVWHVGEYTVDSDFRMVCSKDADDNPVPEFYLNLKDYRKFVKKCKERKAELANLGKAQKTK